jgi:hypothetical protein
MWIASRPTSQYRATNERADRERHQPNHTGNNPEKIHGQVSKLFTPYSVKVMLEKATIE